MKFDLADIYGFAAEAVQYNNDEFTTEDDWLDTRFKEDIPIIGHTQPYYILFWILAQEFNPKFAVELGSWRATASAHIASGAPDAKVVTIDIHKDDQIAHQKILEAAAHYPNLDFIHAWTWDAVERVKAVGLPIDILYIDAWHEYQYVIKEWDLYKPLLADEALVICDDIFDSRGTTDYMVKFWEELDYEKFLNTKVHPTIPMGFLKFVRDE